MNTYKKDWQNAAESTVRLLASTGLIFTSNDVWRLGLETPPNRRWLGPVMQRLAAQGVITKVAEGALSAYGHGSRMNGFWVGSE